MQKLNYIE